MAKSDARMARVEAIVAELPEFERVDIEAWGDEPTFRQTRLGIAPERDIGARGAADLVVENVEMDQRDGVGNELEALGRDRRCPTTQ